MSEPKHLPVLIFTPGASIFALILILVAGCSIPGTVNQPTQETSQVNMKVRASSSPPVGLARMKPSETSVWPLNGTNTSLPTTPLYFTPSLPPPVSARTFTPTPGVKFCTPLEDHSLADLEEILTNPFEPPPAGKDSGHHGVDFAYYRRGDRLSIQGVRIQSVMAGRVASVISNRIPYGNMVIIETPYEELPGNLVTFLQIPSGRSVYLLYAHMKDPPWVKLNDMVQCGQVLGEVGNTPKGWSSNPHLHFEVRIGPPDVTFPGMDYYDTGATLEEMANYRRWRMSGDFVMLDPMRLLKYGLRLLEN